LELKNDALEDSDKIIKGDPTGVALAEVAREEGMEATPWKRLAEIAFDADRKLMTTFHQYGNKIILKTKISTI